MPNEKSSSIGPPPPNKSLQRSGTHTLLGRGRQSLVLNSPSRVRVLTGLSTAPELNR